VEIKRFIECPYDDDVIDEPSTNTYQTQKSCSVSQTKQLVGRHYALTVHRLPEETTAYKLDAMPQVSSLVSQWGQADYAEFSRQKGPGHPSHLSLGSSHALT
jgi:hypothetical protein